MSQTTPTTEIIDADAVPEQWQAVLERARSRQARFLVARNGEPVAAIVSAHDLEILQAYLKRRDEDFAVIDALQERFKDIPSDELEREIERAIAEARAERRAAVSATMTTS